MWSTRNLPPFAWCVWTDSLGGQRGDGVDVRMRASISFMPFLAWDLELTADELSRRTVSSKCATTSRVDSGDGLLHCDRRCRQVV
jgi:hypothetical protein